MQAPFLDIAALTLREVGSLYIATDWANYAAHIDEVLGNCPSFDLAERRKHGGERPLDRATTRFERRGLGQGHQIRDWHFLRSA